jgi:hypothetical protein
MRVPSAGRGVVTIPGRGGRLDVLLAIAAIVMLVAVMALLVWAVPLAMSGAQTANPSMGYAGSAVIHDDAGNVHRTLMPQGAR